MWVGSSEPGVVERSPEEAQRCSIVHASPGEKPGPAAAVMAAASACWSNRQPGLSPLQLAMKDTALNSIRQDPTLLLAAGTGPSAPIEYVSPSWQRLAAHQSDLAALNQPSLDFIWKGAESQVSRAIVDAIARRRACKALVRAEHHRTGERDSYWRMLAISPILHRGTPILWVIAMQDYTLPISKLLTRPPTQFCRSTPYMQRQQLLFTPRPQPFTKPAVREVDQATFARARSQSIESDVQALPPASMAQGTLVKRLGWYGVALEPEYLMERVCDALDALHATYERFESSSPFGDILAVKATLHAHVGQKRTAPGSEGAGLVVNFVIGEDSSTEGTFRVSLTRLAGETLTFHNAFRTLRRSIDIAGEGASHKGVRGTLHTAAALSSSSGSLLEGATASTSRSGQPSELRQAATACGGLATCLASTCTCGVEERAPLASASSFAEAS